VTLKKQQHIDMLEQFYYYFLKYFFLKRMWWRCKNQQHIDMLEQFYTNIMVALKWAASEVLTNSPKQKHNVPGWNKDVREKNKATWWAYLYILDWQS